MEIIFSDLDVAEAEVLALTADDPEDAYLIVSLGRLDRSPESNWVEKSGGLPKYIEDIAHSLHTKRGMTISRAIATAVSRVKKWAAGGDDVKPDTVAKAQKALAQWEALKAKNKARRAVKGD